MVAILSGWYNKKKLHDNIFTYKLKILQFDASQIFCWYYVTCLRVEGTKNNILDFIKKT